MPRFGRRLKRMKGVPFGVNGEWNLLIGLYKRGVNRRIRIKRFKWGQIPHGS